MEYLIVGIIAVIVFLILILIIKVEGIRNKANALFLEAEKRIEKENRLEYVCVNLYDYVPAVAKIFIDEELFRTIVQYLYDNTRKLAKDLLDNGKLDKSNKEE